MYRFAQGSEAINALNNKSDYSSRATIRTAFISAVVLSLISIMLCYFALSVIKQNVLEDFGKSLNAVLDSNLEALELWSDQQQLILEQIADSEFLTTINGNAFAEMRDEDTALTQRIQDEMNRLQSIKTSLGFMLLTPNGNYIASNIELGLNYGEKSPISQEYAGLLNLAKQQSVFVPPVKFNSAEKGEDVTLLLFITPIQKSGNTTALLASFYAPEYQLSDIASLGRIGESGETYLFDRNAMMVSRSRFESTLQELSFLEANSNSILNIKLYNPGINIYENPSSQRDESQLTLMAQSALSGLNQSNLEGYRDYRGIYVVGTWKWLPSLQLGITTEVDLQEALASYHSSRAIILSLLIISLCITAGLGAYLVRISLKATRALHRSAIKLEETVELRTQELSTALAALKDEQTVLQCLFDNIPDPIFCKDNEKRYIKGNHAFFDIFNKTPEQVIGFTDKEISHPEDLAHFQDTDQQVLDSGQTIVFERVANHENYQDRIFETRKSLIPFPNNKAPGIIAISRDVTEQRELEESLIQSSIAADAANRAKSDFLARMSHEIRTPMNGVIGMLDLVMDTQLTLEQKQKLDVAKNSAESLLGIINDILDFSRVEANKLELDIVDFDLPKQIEETARALAIKAEVKGLELLVDVTSINQPMVKGDPLRIRQILTNLINNAIKFTHAGQIHIRAQTEINDTQVLFSCSVSDTGIGIAQDKIASLFESFTQADSSTTRVYGGSGLGLAISKKLCQLMNGNIWAQSTLGEGSTFSFKIALVTSKLSQKHLPKLDIIGLRALVVDDNDVNLTILSNQLNKIGIVAQCASSADEALKLFENQCFDLLITDMNMPHKDGLSLVKQVRESKQNPGIKVIMLSSMSFNSNRSELKSMGLDGCLLKPVAHADLINLIKLLHDSEQSIDETITEQALLAFNHSAHDLSLPIPSYHKVLIVEDNPVNMMVAQGLLKKLGLYFDQRYNGRECIDALLGAAEDQPFNLILMDCQMPVLDGYSATRRIRQGEAGERYKAIPIVAMTANAMQWDAEKCLSYGMNFHVPKPIDNKYLIDILTQAFNLVPAVLKNHSMPDVGYQAESLSQFSTLTVPHQSLRTMQWHAAPPSLSHDPVMYMKSLALFKQHFGTQEYRDFALLYDAASSEQKNTLSKALHTLKGSAGNMGFVSLKELCSDLESKLSKGELLSQDLSKLDNTLKAALSDADTLMSHNPLIADSVAKAASNEDTDSIDKKTLPELYQQIYVYTQERELVPFELVDELKTLSKQVPSSDPVHTLISLLERFDYENSSALIAEQL